LLAKLSRQTHVLERELGFETGLERLFRNLGAVTLICAAREKRSKDEFKEICTIEPDALGKYDALSHCLDRHGDHHVAGKLRCIRTCGVPPQLPDLLAKGNEQRLNRGNGIGLSGCQNVKLAAR